MSLTPRRRWLLTACIVTALSPMAIAQPVVQSEPTVHAGTQALPPVSTGDPALHQEVDGRRAVRGCSIDEHCARPADQLREIELQMFPPPGGNPWVDERTAPGSRVEARRPRTVKRPSELRPDAPWLDALELPDLPVVWSQKLVDYLVFYRDDPRGRAIMESWLTAQGRYRDMILGYLRKAHLPQDLLYVAMIESGYDPDDTSYAGALGLWQFMPEGGRIYGLREDRWVDERRDPYRSTIAQMDYFADLMQRFGDWHIALAAFNAGYGAVLRSVARYNTNDYYALCELENGLPWETCLYTPKIMAAAIVGHNRATFGYDKIKEAPPERWDDVSVPMSISLSVLARAAGTNEADIKRLNPQLRRGRTPPGESAYVVRVPAGAKQEFARRLADLQSDWGGYDAYVVAHGERFEDVATTFGMTQSALRKLNDIKEGEVEGGTILVVPKLAADVRERNRAKARTSLHSSGVDQKPGEPLLVAIPDKDFTVSNKRRVFYRVVSGDTLADVASSLNVSKADLATWNALDPTAKLQPRMVLVAFVARSYDPTKARVVLLDDAQLQVVTRGSTEHLDISEARTGRVRTQYTAQGKEKLADVAKKFGLGSHDLARINRISYDTVLEKGQTIIVYEVADRSRSKRAEEQAKKTPRGHRGKVTGTRAEHTATSKKHDDDDGDAGPITKPSQDE